MKSQDRLMSQAKPQPGRSITWRAARHAAAIPLGRAVGPLNIEADQILRIERGEAQANPELNRRAIELYGLPPGTILVPEDASTGVTCEGELSPSSAKHRATLPRTLAYRPDEIIKAREARGWSAPEASREARISLSAYYHLEKGKPTLRGETALAALRVYGIEPLQGEDAEAPGVVKLAMRRPVAGVGGVRATRAGGDTSDAATGAPPTGPQSGDEDAHDDPALPALATAAGRIELIRSPAPGYLIGRRLVDRNALRALGGELVPLDQVPLWGDQVVADLDAPPIDLDPTLQRPNGVSEVYREELVDEILAGETSFSELAVDLARLTLGRRIAYREAGRRLDLSETTAKNYFFDLQSRVAKLWEDVEVRRDGVKLFGEVYGVNVDVAWYESLYGEVVAARPKRIRGRLRPTLGNE